MTTIMPIFLSRKNKTAPALRADAVWTYNPDAVNRLRAQIIAADPITAVIPVSKTGEADHQKTLFSSYTSDWTLPCRRKKVKNNFFPLDFLVFL
jgi:hypothetical protein